MSRYYAATTPTWHVPRSNTLEWVIAYLFVLDLFFQCMSYVPVVGYGCWLSELSISLLLFVLIVLLLRVRR